MRTYEEKKKKLYENMTYYLKEDVCLAIFRGVDSSLLLTLAKKMCKRAAKKNLIFMQ